MRKAVLIWLSPMILMSYLAWAFPNLPDQVCPDRPGGRCLFNSHAIIQTDRIMDLPATPDRDSSIPTERTIKP